MTPQPHRNYTDAVTKDAFVSVTTRLPQDIHAQAVELAREQRSSLNRLVVVALERYIRQTKARQPRAGEGH
jgi:predicted transcriptional regulator